jgi:hypothetical protein
MSQYPGTETERRVRFQRLLSAATAVFERWA